MYHIFFIYSSVIELPYDPAIPLLGIYPEKTIIQKDTCTPMFIAAQFTIARTWKQPKCPMIEVILKSKYIYLPRFYDMLFLVILFVIKVILFKVLVCYFVYYQISLGRTMELLM